MLTFFKKMFGKKEDPEDFVLMGNDILYNDFIVKENVQNSKFTKSKDIATNSIKQEENINSELSFKPDNIHNDMPLKSNVGLQSQNQNIEETFTEFRKQDQKRSDSYQPADMNMVNIHENLKDVVVDELESTIVVPRRTNIENIKKTSQNNNSHIENRIGNDPPINTENRIGNDPPINIENRIGNDPPINIENRIGNDPPINNESIPRRVNNSWMINDNSLQTKNISNINENKTYNPNKEFINNENNYPQDRNSLKYRDEDVYKNNNIIVNKEEQIQNKSNYQDYNQEKTPNLKNQWKINEKAIPQSNDSQRYIDNINNYDNDWQEYGKRVQRPNNEVAHNQPIYPQTNSLSHIYKEENELSTINIVPINREAKEKYDTENNYRINPELENTQNLSILQFYKDLNHFKELSEEEKIFLAVEKAKNTLHYFVKVISNPSNNIANFSVKVKLRDDMKEENLWINDVKYDNFVFEGFLGNFPKVIKNVKYGDVLKIHIDDVIDWMFIENKRLIGGYSIRVARSLMNEQDREKFDKSLFFFIDEGEDNFREDLSTPEGAVTTYEEAFRRKDLNIILKCKNFKEEAKIYMLKKFGSFFYDEKSLVDLQESLKLSFIKKIEIEGFNKINWVKRAFTRRDYIDEDLVLVTEWVFRDDGTKSRLRYYVWRNPNYIWKVLCEEK